VAAVLIICKKKTTGRSRWPAHRPAAVGVGAVIHKAVLTEEALAAEGLHVHRHPVTGPDSCHSGADFLHHTHQFMANGDAGNRPGHRAMLDV